MILPLIQIAEDETVRVLDIKAGWGIRGRLGHMGIHPGDRIIVLKRGALGGPILIGVHGFQVALGRGIAAKIWVEEME